MAGVTDVIKDAVKRATDAVKSGNDEATGLSGEMKSTGESYRQGTNALKGDPVAAPSAPRTGAGVGGTAKPYGSQGKEKRIDTTEMQHQLGTVYDKGGIVGGTNLPVKAKVKEPVKQAPIVMKVDTGKPASSLPPLTPDIKPTPTAPLVYDKGGKVNIHDGKHQLAILKEGERVLTPEQTKVYDKGGKVMATPYDMVSGGKTPKKEIKEMVHSKTHNGKHVITHKHHSPVHHPDETHMFNNLDEAKDHMDQHAGDEPAEGAAPMTAAPSPMAPAAGAPVAAGAPPAGM
jgi:hypothetical protein